MLVHIGQGDVAEKVHNAWLTAIEDGIHTYDIFDPEVSSEKVGTSAFADAVIARIGKQPSKLAAASYPATSEPFRIEVPARTPQHKELVGIDVFVEFRGPVADLGARLEAHAGDLELVMISNRGQKVYPGGVPETLTTDHWRCRFQAADRGIVTTEATIALLGRLAADGLPFVKSEGLFTFDGEPGFSLGQGQ
jgi:isocitrate dehydrogenase